MWFHVALLHSLAAHSQQEHRMGIPVRSTEVLGPTGSRRGVCPGGVDDLDAAKCRYNVTANGVTCACCPLLSELLLHRAPEIDKPRIIVATETADVRRRGRLDVLRTLRRFRRPATRDLVAWLPSSWASAPFDRRLVALLAIAVLPGFWVWPLRGHIKTVTVRIFSLARRSKGVREPHRQGRQPKEHV